MKGVQAKHIDADSLVAEVARREREHLPRSPWALAEHFGVPVKVMQAKITTMDRQGLIEGCGCGCGSPVCSARKHTRTGT